MKRISTLFVQTVIILIAVITLFLMLLEPQLEGRNKQSTLFQTYFTDPFLAYAYIASAAFFTGLYQTFKLAGYVRQNKILSDASVKAVQTIKYCAVALLAFVGIGEIFIMLSASDDRAGGVFIGILIAVGSIVAATTAATFERLLQKLRR